ncbi:hypothetical protein Enr10x_21000 [Gimesia panareensis]|uniref:Uncharacterized protein n=1 Tax=Gimesia panareensis TaxID=2527978 RepID=A0A517Q579_9PLAN|nr:hypothetical protein [Gimesia panareensis]QDT26790.1 hypothetical protein Enr10x_21000 [Gimesia panareensis]
MSTETLIRLDDSGKTIYFAIFNASGQVFDFNSGVLAFADLGDAVEPSLAATEYADAGGFGKSQYIASLNLATINNTAALLSCTAIAFEQAGGSPDLTTDAPRSQPAPLEIQFGREGQNQISIHCGISTDSTSGSYLEVQAWLESNGAVIPLSASATCSCQIRQIDAEADGIQITTANFGNVNSQYIFVHSKANPSLENDRQYRAKITITEGGTSWSTTVDFVVLP